MGKSHLAVVSLAILCGILIGEVVADDLSADLSPKQLAEIRDAVDHGLEWLSTQQNADGSFSSNEGPAMHPTSYAVLAFLSRGHQPGQGRYGRQMSRGIEFILSAQRPDGSLSTRPPQVLPLSYTHALSGLALSEVYGSISGAPSESIGVAIKRALAYSRMTQQTPKLYAAYRGGWEYETGEHTRWSCVPTTCWELTFMRSAHNAGFDVPQLWVDEGLEFIKRCYQPGPRLVGTRRVPVNPNQGVFLYYPIPPRGRPIWANYNTTAAGTLALQIHGRRDDPMVHKTVDWLAQSAIPRQNSIPRFYYGCYIRSQAVAQAGGAHWNSYFPRLVRTLLSHQDPEGYWRLDGHIGWGGEDELGPAYYTALAVLCLTLPDQLLPIHQQ